MSRYTVAWVQDAQNQLAEIWIAATDRQAVTDAANEIDRELGGDAASKGVPVSDGLRGLEVAPLRVLFSVRAISWSRCSVSGVIPHRL